MGLCATSCSTSTPNWTDSCDITTRDGGIKYLVFFSCDWAFNSTVTVGGISTVTGPITDYTAWELGVHNRMITRTPLGKGDKPNTEVTTQRLNACSPAVITSRTHAVNFTSYDVDSTNLTDQSYWDGIRSNYGKFRVAYWDCNDIIYYTGDQTDPGFVWTPTVGPDYVIPETNDEAAYYQITASFKYNAIPTPIQVTSINTAFLTDVRT